ncbi:MAG TPA: efflux RND transporter permease subunit [Alphaproteobacteria bacterium]|nr:efflux RND transporter permease subunit [Alphaproteobacteria bacterium]
MSLTELLIRRPVLATVVNLIVVLVGLVSFDRLTVREYPNIDTPSVTVQTTYRGAPADIIESQVTKPLENSVSGIDGIDYISSISRLESSQITVNFTLNRDVDSAASDVRDRVARVRKALPDQIDEPVIAKVEADAQPIIWLALSSTSGNLMEVSDYAYRVIQNRLQTLPGVADVRIFGERRPAMRVWPDPARLAAAGVTVLDIEQALRAQNIDVPSGLVESAEREFTVKVNTDTNSPREFMNIVVRNVTANGIQRVVRLGDVAKVEVGPADDRSFTRFNGVNSIGMGIIRQSTANPIDVSDALKQVLPELRRNMPPGMSINIAFDSSVFIKESIRSVYHTIGEAVVLVALVTFIFLGSWRATIIPLVTIPVALVGTFALIALAGATINTLTLLALVLAIGLVVDDAIVVLENIYRHIEEGMEPRKAAIKGIGEIVFAVLAMTMTLAAVFAPLAFATGHTGKLFAEFALTLAGAVIISGFTAITLSPMMCGKLLRHEKKHGWLREKVDFYFDKLTVGYTAALEWSLARRKLVLVGVALVAGGIGGTLWLLKSELAPMEDRGVIYMIVQGPDGATPSYTDKYARAVEAIVAQVPEKAWQFAAVGFPTTINATMPTGLVPWGDRDRTSMQIAQSLFPRLAQVPGVLAFAVTPPSLGQRSTSKPVSIVLQSAEDYPTLARLADEFMARARQNPGLANVDSDLKLNKPEFRVALQRDKMNQVGVTVADVGATLGAFLGGDQVTRFKRNGEQYDVIVQLNRAERSTPADLAGLPLRTAKGDLIQLGNVVDITQNVSPRELNHFNKLRAATVTATLSQGYSLGEALDYLDKLARDVGKGKLQVDFADQSREYRQSGSAMLLSFALALGFIYLVLSAQFESFVSPITIMASVPLAVFGALLLLLMTMGTLNVFSQIGLLTLVGLITKHGIMLVEFANSERGLGLDPFRAIEKACLLRLRPILMTTFATILGAVPLALAGGAGEQSRSQIGWVIVGGMALGTLLTLFVVPTVYTLMAPKKAPGEEHDDEPEAKKGKRHA